MLKPTQPNNDEHGVRFSVFRRAYFRIQVILVMPSCLYGTGKISGNELIQSVWMNEYRV